MKRLKLQLIGTADCTEFNAPLPANRMHLPHRFIERRAFTDTGEHLLVQFRRNTIHYGHGLSKSRGSLAHPIDL